MIYFIADTSFTSRWERFWLFYESRYVIKQYGNGDVRVYGKMNLFWLWPVINDCADSAFSSVEDACAWCEKQINGNKVKSVTYVMED